MKLFNLCILANHIPNLVGAARERDALRAELSAARAEAEQMRGVLTEVAAERTRQDAKWGEQNHPDGTSPALAIDGVWYIGANMLADAMRQRCKDAHDLGKGTYEHILTEEWAEVIATENPVDLRNELVQLAAVCIAWAEKIDRDAALTTPDGQGGEADG